MPEPIAYLNGIYVPASQAQLSVFDLGVVGGVAVAEMLRTFRHAPFRVDAHFARLEQSLVLTGLQPAQPREDLRTALDRVVAENCRLLSDADDLGVIVFVTAGLNPTYVGREAAQAAGCSVGVHTFPLQRALWAGKYDTGVALATPSLPALPGEVVDRRIKSRSRLHWHLAERAARALQPGASALLLDAQERITETAAANFCAVLDGVIVSPSEGTVLEGVSLQMVAELARDLSIPFVRRDLTVADAARASECFVTSTPPCLLPVASLNGVPIGDGRPGPIYRHLLAAWSAAVGVDIRGQMQRGS